MEGFDLRSFRRRRDLRSDSKLRDRFQRHHRVANHLRRAHRATDQAVGKTRNEGYMTRRAQNILTFPKFKVARIYLGPREFAWPMEEKGADQCVGKITAKRIGQAEDSSLTTLFKTFIPFTIAFVFRFALGSYRFL